MYSLILVQKAFHGKPREDGHGAHLEDLSKRELAMMGLLMALLLGIGLYPQPVLNTSATAMKTVELQYQPAAATAALSAPAP